MTTRLTMLTKTTKVFVDVLAFVFVVMAVVTDVGRHWSFR
jgi:hypothetical protein